MLTTLSLAELILLVSGLCIVAMMYAMVGHGGGSGYIAVLALASFAPETLRPIALTLNIFVASISTFAFNKQKKPPFFIFANLVAARCSAIIEQNNMFPRPSSPIVVDREYAFDLDTTGDIEVGECLIAARAKSNP